MASSMKLKYVHFNNNYYYWWLFPLYQVRFYAAELILALEHIHSQLIVYRDLKVHKEWSTSYLILYLFHSPLPPLSFPLFPSPSPLSSSPPLPSPLSSSPFPPLPISLLMYYWMKRVTYDYRILGWLVSSLTGNLPPVCKFLGLTSACTCTPSLPPFFFPSLSLQWYTRVYGSRGYSEGSTVW